MSKVSDRFLAFRPSLFSHFERLGGDGLQDINKSFLVGRFPGLTEQSLCAILELLVEAVDLETAERDFHALFRDFCSSLVFSGGARETRRPLACNSTIHSTAQDIDMRLVNERH